MSDELKPCPFCASPGCIESSNEKPETFYVECSNISCMCSMGEDPRTGAGEWPDVHFYDSLEACVKAWNTRAKPVITEEMVERALQSWYGRQWTCGSGLTQTLNRENMRAALSAALTEESK